eukprot:TRINITY_DN274_c0_g2_i2.p1 TRINITY_DN274_c0_g2~~TRINITY_DN274_c0_g2_i2.p1  ORF type:complete len:618 (-),score=118.92 TRINITY_DN274_c0_g2_i2:222-1814(-)
MFKRRDGKKILAYSKQDFEHAYSMPPPDAADLWNALHPPSLITLIDERGNTLKKRRLEDEVKLRVTSTAIAETKTYCVVWDELNFPMVDSEECWENLRAVYESQDWNHNQQEDKYHERFQFIILKIVKHFDIKSAIRSDLGHGGNKKKAIRVPDIELIFNNLLLLDVEVKKFWNEKSNLLPWDTLPTASKNNAALALVQLHDRAKVYLGENDQRVSYGIITDSVKLYFLKIDCNGEGTVIYFSRKYDLGIGEDVLLPEHRPDGFVELCNMLHFLNFLPKGSGLKSKDILNHQEKIKISGKYYILLSELGETSNSIVYSAISEEGRTVCVKFSYEKDALENEIKILNILKGTKGVPKILDCEIFSNNTSVLVTNVVGISIASLRGTIQYQENEYIFLEVAKILNRVHDRKVVHCDVKPEHIIISPDGVFLIDFGSSYNIGEEWSHRATMLYASTHVLYGGTAEFQDDYISLFYSFYHTTSGKLPWETVKLNPKDLNMEYRWAQEEGHEMLKKEFVSFIENANIKTNDYDWN